MHLYSSFVLFSAMFTFSNFLTYGSTNVIFLDIFHRLVFLISFCFYGVLDKNRTMGNVRKYICMNVPWS
jgi:hypothetical protein